MYKPLVAAALIVGGTLQLAAPALADGTAAGTTISNTATATYDDPDGNTINATSNKVDIKVAEVAGIDVSSNNTPTGAAPGGTIDYDFVVTNTGNDPTKIVLPSTASVSGPGTVTSVIISTDATFGNGDDQVITGPYTTPSVAAGEKVYVRVVVTVNAGASTGTAISVEYGKSATPASTNQDYVANGALDAKTQDNLDTDGVAGEVNGAPVNGVREDSAVSATNVADAPGVLNGPNTQPGATGADSTTRTDFTNKTTSVPAGTSPTTTIDPTAITFTNTIQNTGNGSNPFTVVPTTATGILVAGGNLPDGTKVTIKDPVANKTAEYTWNQATGTFTIKAGDTPVVITIASGGTANYEVIVDLPTGTDLSTKLTTPGDFNTAVGGFPVPIAAYIEDATPGFQGTEVNNITTDRLYTGYMAMYKEAQILGADNTTVEQTWTTDTTLLTAKARPNYYIQYRISYKNISVAVPSGSNSIGLTATGFAITEDGLTAPNNWAKDNDTNSKIDTSSVLGSASGAGTISYFNNAPAVAGTDQNGDGTAANEVTKYVNTVGDVAPNAATGTFTFKRKIN
ncbi:MAG: hypothetical protein KME17_26060 [Cyanosarcina radialis HA8281-LM2]|nr:hypothetical protein [Cyanosarcina radialis HA8281-LM2]